MKLLIAEDNPINRMINEQMMDHWGYDFDMAVNGQEAVALARANKGRYDLCLMDVEMPEMNGIEATKMIRNVAGYFPILGFTASDGYRRACYEAGMDGFMVKPCRPDELFAKISELVVKLYRIVTKAGGFGVDEVKPVDQKHAQELRALKEQNLVKIKFDDISGAEVVIHENIINKIVDDFNVKKQFVSTFLNRNPDKPTKCVLFANNCRMPQVYLDDDDYASELRAENEVAKEYPEMVLRVDRDE